MDGAGITVAGNRALSETLMNVLRSNQIEPGTAQEVLTDVMDQWRQEWVKISSVVGMGHGLSGMIEAEAEVLGRRPHVSEFEARCIKSAQAYTDRRTAQMEALMVRFCDKGADPDYLPLSPPITRGSRLTGPEAWMINAASEWLPSLTESGWPVLDAGEEPTEKQIQWLSTNWFESAKVWAASRATPHREGE